jgi:hypothetical protein
MIGLFFGIAVMIMVTTFLEAQAKYRSTWDSTIHRKTNLIPYTEIAFEPVKDESL